MVNRNSFGLMGLLPRSKVSHVPLWLRDLTLAHERRLGLRFDDARDLLLERSGPVLLHKTMEG